MVPQPSGRWPPSAVIILATGTLVVWNADVLKEELVRVYRAQGPDNPTVYRRGWLAEAEPAVPGWTFPVDDLLAGPGPSGDRVIGCRR
jgi:hypothetical protein